MKKTYVIDTNVILSDPKALDAFEDNDLIVPLSVLEELDKHKNRQDDVGSCARQVNRSLDKLREKGNLLTGVTTPGGGTLRIASVSQAALNSLPVELRSDKVDHVIIAHVLQLRDEGVDAILVSKDINVRVKCDALGVKCEDYRKLRIASSPDALYTGVKVLELAYEDVQSIYDDGEMKLPPDTEPYYPNQIVVVKNVVNQKTMISAITRVIPDGNSGLKLQKIKERNAYGLTPRNKEQKFALDLLFDDRVKLVSLIGISGSGKTLLALAAGLSQLRSFGDEPKYNKLIVTRSAQPVGRDLGFLPGNLHEKMDPWLSPVKDNLNFLMSKASRNHAPPRRGQKMSAEGPNQDPYFSLMIERGLIEVEAITYIRGRSIPDTYMVIDECQNLTMHELKTIVTRVGENTKIILTGDINQIDNPHIDIFSNGLTHAVEKFKNSQLSGHVTMLKGERSALASEASNIL